MLKAFENRQSSYIKSNELEKSIAMQFIDQHNTTIKLRTQNKNFKRFLRNLHSNQENLIYHLFDEGHINENQTQFLMNIVTNLKLNRVTKVENTFF